MSDSTLTCTPGWTSIPGQPLDPDAVVSVPSVFGAVDLLDRLHTAEAMLAILENERRADYHAMLLILARNAATDGGGTYNDLLEWTEARRPRMNATPLEAENVALRQFRETVPWDDIYEAAIIAYRTPEELTPAEQEAIVRAVSWHDLNAPKEATP